MHERKNKTCSATSGKKKPIFLDTRATTLPLRQQQLGKHQQRRMKPQNHTTLQAGKAPIKHGTKRSTNRAHHKQGNNPIGNTRGLTVNEHSTDWIVANTLAPRELLAARYQVANTTNKLCGYIPAKDGWENNDNMYTSKNSVLMHPDVHGRLLNETPVSTCLWMNSSTASQKVCGAAGTRGTFQRNSCTNYP